MRDLQNVAFSCLLAATPAFGQAPELPEVTRAVERVARALRLDGAGFTVACAEAELHRSVHGQHTAETVLPIASASKWLAVATILTLVADGTLDLDLPVARYVEEFDRDDRRRITLRQCLSCTSGLPARLGRMRGWDMQRFAREVADTALRGQPGDSFLYGGVGFQLVAVAAERATEKSWHELFAQRIAGPLGMDHTRFGSLRPIGSDPGTTPLPWVAGGAVSTLADYTVFVRMLLADGQWQGKRILPQRLVAELLRDQVPPRVEVHSAALPKAHLRYGLGTWIERLDDGRLRLSDPGAFGFTPWIDPQLEIGGVFAVQDRVARVLRHLERVHAVVHEVVTSPAVAGTAETVRLHQGGRVRRYHLHVPPHAPNEPGLPLLLVLHDEGSDGAGMRAVSGLDRVGVRSGFVVAFPDGTERLPKKRRGWTVDEGGDVDDVGFLRQVVADAMQRAPIDARRVFVVGYGSGGTLGHRLARVAPDRIAGVAVVAAPIAADDAPIDRPIAALLIHGTADRRAPIDGGKPESGGRGPALASLQQTVDAYVAGNGLLAYPESHADGGVQVARYARGRNGADVPPVEVVRLVGGNHAWPGARQRLPDIPGAPFDWSAARAIVRFFAAQ